MEMSHAEIMGIAMVSWITLIIEGLILVTHEKLAQTLSNIAFFFLISFTILASLNVLLFYVAWKLYYKIVDVLISKGGLPSFAILFTFLMFFVPMVYFDIVNLVNRLVNRDKK